MSEPAGAPSRFEFTAKAARDLRQVDDVDHRRPIAAIEALAERPLRDDVRKLRGAEDEWRLRSGTGAFATSGTRPSE